MKSYFQFPVALRAYAICVGCDTIKVAIYCEPFRNHIQTTPTLNLAIIYHVLFT